LCLLRRKKLEEKYRSRLDAVVAGLGVQFREELVAVVGLVWKSHKFSFRYVEMEVPLRYVSKDAKHAAGSVEQGLRKTLG
jgi:hypothetical protein